LAAQRALLYGTAQGPRDDGLPDRGNDMGQNGKGCILCGGTAREGVSQRDRHGEPLDTALCPGCGLIRNDPVPTQADLDAFYGSAYRESYKGASVPRLRQIWRNFDRTRKHLVAFRDVYGRGGRWLDLGSGSGEFLFLAGAAGAQAEGIEPHEGYSVYCRESLGLSVRTATLETCGYAEGSFDLIRLSHVLEHMRDPVASLRVLRGWLKPGGVLYVEVPDIEVEAQTRIRGRLFHFGHINNFNPVTLRALAGLAGLTELPQTAARTAGTTGIFLVASDAVVPDPALLSENAARLRAVMAEHNARLVPKPQAGNAAVRFFSRLRQRMRDVLAGARLRSPRAIAEDAAARLRQGLAG
jgi:SAM-dependent methyltransferase